MIPKLTKKQILILVVVIIPIYIVTMYYIGVILNLMIGA